jgi:GT2 family glycosyltransferase
MSTTSFDSAALRRTRVAAVIITHNRRSKLTECIDSLLASHYPFSEIIVVDNASTDGTADYLAIQYPSVSVLPQRQNLLVSAAANLGMAHSSADYFLVLADDNVVAPGMLNELLTEAITRGAGVAAPKMLFKSEPDRLWSLGAKFSFRTGVCRHRAAGELDRGQWDQVWEPDCVHNALMIARWAIDTIGPFDQWNFPMQNEEADLCARAKRNGIAVITVPSARIWHDVETTTSVLRVGARDFTVNSPFRAYLTARSRTFLVRKYGSLADKAIYMTMFLLPITLAYLAIILLGGPDRVRIARSYLTGTFAGIFRRLKPISPLRWANTAREA